MVLEHPYLTEFPTNTECVFPATVQYQLSEIVGTTKNVQIIKVLDNTGYEQSSLLIIILIIHDILNHDVELETTMYVLCSHISQQKSLVHDAAPVLYIASMSRSAVATD